MHILCVADYLVTLNDCTKVHSSILMVYPCLSSLTSRAARNSRRNPTLMKFFCNKFLFMHIDKSKSTVCFMFFSIIVQNVHINAHSFNVEFLILYTVDINVYTKCIISWYRGSKKIRLIIISIFILLLKSMYIYASFVNQLHAFNFKIRLFLLTLYFTCTCYPIIMQKPHI